MRSGFFAKMTMVVLIALFLTSCASIVSNSHYPITISTNPSTANIEIKDKRNLTIYQGSSPAVVSLPAGQGYFSKSEYFVHISKPGFQEAVIPVFFSLDGWYFGNLLLGGVLGMLIVDPITGAMWKLETSLIHHNLSPDPQGQIDNIPNLRVIDIADVPEKMRSKLIPIPPNMNAE